MSGMWGRNSDERVWGSLDSGGTPSRLLFPVPLPVALSSRGPAGGSTRRAGDWAGLEGD